MFDICEVICVTADSCFLSLNFSFLEKNYTKHSYMVPFLQGIKSMQSLLQLGSRRMSSAPGVVECTIRNKLQSSLETKHLEVINESYMHNVPKGAETHFKVVVVSDKFDGLPLIKRHRLVNDLLKAELQTGVHALSIVAKTPQQWAESDKVVESSPTCRGGFGK